MRPPEEVRKELVAQWLEKADADLKSAEVIRAAGPGLNFAVAFHAQQAAEKYLKAYLTHRQVEFPKTHNIAELLVMISKADPTMAKELDDAAELTPYGVETRYPGDLPEPTDSEAMQAVSLAAKVRDNVLAAIHTSN